MLVSLNEGLIKELGLVPGGAASAEIAINLLLKKANHLEIENAKLRDQNLEAFARGWEAGQRHEDMKVETPKAAIKRVK